jgi:hypothetical protein
MNQVAPDAVARTPFCSREEGGDTLPAATAAHRKAMRERPGWAH